MMYARLALGRATRVATARRAFSGSARLQLVSGACELPHPQKRATGGEDAWFIGGNTVGVADGVGGWARKGIDSGEYSRTLMSSARAAVGAGDSVLPTPLQLLTHAHGKVKCAGSSTACIVQLHEATLRTINLGDSGFLLCRLLPPRDDDDSSNSRGDSEDAVHVLKWQVVYEAPHQSHYFNCPYQLGYNNGDPPEQGQLVELSTQDGDLIVLGTDGLFDNLFPAQITSLLDTVLPPTPEIDAASMEKVASCLAHTAHKAAKGTKNRTPFAQAATRAGYEYTGGKMDDITVVASLVATAAAVSRL